MEKSSYNIKVALFINTAFAIIEVGGGLYTHSLAILTDALHDFGDSISLGLAWYFQKLSLKKRDDKYSYGYQRFSILGALINAIILLIGSIFILREAIPSLLNPREAHAPGMIVLAVIGVFANSIAALQLHKGASLNEKVVSLHFLEDILGWIAVLIGAVIMFFWDLPIIDPILSIGIAIFILINVFRNLRKGAKIILQAYPDGVELKKIQEKIVAVKGVKGVHDIHIWSLDGKYNILTVHIEVDPSSILEDLSVIKFEVKKLLKKENIQHPTIEFELAGEPCPDKGNKD